MAKHMEGLAAANGEASELNHPGRLISSDNKLARPNFQDRKRPTTDAAGPCAPAARRASGGRKLIVLRREDKPEETALAAAFARALQSKERER